MRQYNDALDALRFTEEEQAMLTKKLEQAAQAAQRPRKRRHPRRVMCIAAAVAILCSTTAFALKKQLDPSAVSIHRPNSGRTDGAAGGKQHP